MWSLFQIFIFTWFSIDGDSTINFLATTEWIHSATEINFVASSTQLLDFVAIKSTVLRSHSSKRRNRLKIASTIGSS